MAFTAGFATWRHLRDHFDKLKVALGITTEQEYLARADRFLGGTPGPTVLCGDRPNGDHIRLDLITQEFGVLSATGVIRTFHIKSHRKDAAWFRRECQRTP